MGNILKSEIHAVISIWLDWWIPRYVGFLKSLVCRSANEWGRYAPNLRKKHWQPGTRWTEERRKKFVLWLLVSLSCWLFPWKSETWFFTQSYPKPLQGDFRQILLLDISGFSLFSEASKILDRAAMGSPGFLVYRCPIEDFSASNIYI